MRFVFFQNRGHSGLRLSVPSVFYSVTSVSITSIMLRRHKFEIIFEMYPVDVSADFSTPSPSSILREPFVSVSWRNRRWKWGCPIVLTLQRYDALMVSPRKIWVSSSILFDSIRFRSICLILPLNILVINWKSFTFAAVILIMFCRITENDNICKC